jgi:hypothetical protein
MLDHWFWLGLSVACVVWYTTITGYVAVKGWADIQSMFRGLARQKHPENPPDPDHA